MIQPHPTGRLPQADVDREFVALTARGGPLFDVADRTRTRTLERPPLTDLSDRLRAAGL